MTDYFSEYSSFVGSSSLPSQQGTPYETPFETLPSYIRSKRSSRATAGSSREQSSSPPPLPSDAADYAEKTRDGRYPALDPRRLTPTLHASLVSEILSLRRELDSKNHLVENLETSLSTSRLENEALGEQLSQHQKDVRKAKQEIQQIEKGTYDAVEDLVKERDAARRNAEELRSKLDVATKRARYHDENAERTQSIWDTEKEDWENERRQLERRIHVTENRLRTVVDEMTTQQLLSESHLGEGVEESTFKDSGLGNESDTNSIQSATLIKHRRNMSSISFDARNNRDSGSTRDSTGVPEPHAKPNGYSLADELGIEEEDEDEVEDVEHADDEREYPHSKRRSVDSRASLRAGEYQRKAKRVLERGPDMPDSPSHTRNARFSFTDLPRKSVDTAIFMDTAPRAPQEDALAQHVQESPALLPRVLYVDTGYQPSPPPSPDRKAINGDYTEESQSVSSMTNTKAHTHDEVTGATTALASPAIVTPVSPPETPIVDGTLWPSDSGKAVTAHTYKAASTQTDLPEMEQRRRFATQRDSLTVPPFVPSIAIHPPTSRPSSPRGYVLPPGTKNASTQANRIWPCKDASVQTAEIRVDTRLRRLPSHLHPSRVNSLLPSPKLLEAFQTTRTSTGGAAAIFTDGPFAPSIPSPPARPPQSPTESIPETPRNYNAKDARNLPLRAIPLGRPVLAPAHNRHAETSEGPLNRSSQYGVTRPLQSSSQLADMDTDASDLEELPSDVESKDLSGSVPAISRAPQGRFGLSQPPKVVPEDKEISPDRRPDTADSYGAAPAPSIASSRANSQRTQSKPPAKLNAYKDFRSRSPSFGSMASSNISSQSALPPQQIPMRTSSRAPAAKAASDGSQSPTPNGEVSARGVQRGVRPSHARQNSLRKVQSAAVIRPSARGGRTSPQKGVRRRRRSPDLTPVQSMAFDTPAHTQFPIPALPIPLLQQDKSSFEMLKGSVDLTGAVSTVAPSTHVGSSEETQLVDAIAATMVGEWMFKYIRKRKSFGVSDEALNDVGGQGANTNHGTRHKRWVWLSPYERAIMWDNKQPTSGPALLGKKGRKLTIQSVLDVPDNAALPKNAELDSAYSRSILVLTPQRALKFTTVSLERHILWMTALSFLAQSGRLPAPFPPSQELAPPPPAVNYPPSNAANRSQSPSFGRATIRDSVRLAKGRRPSLHQSVSQPAESALAKSEEPTDNADSAEFPAVPRLYVSTTRHQRKRSNTSPRLPAPLNNLRSVSSSAIASSTASRRLHPSSSTTGSYVRSSSSKSNSRQGSVGSPVQANFFEAFGTVRMDAFVDPNMRNGVLYVPAPPPVVATQGPRRRRVDSNLSTSTVDKRRAGFVFDENGTDPFKGF
ncbi:hypothetical protein BAUCODRAFT_493226 [Baudoinia panamericana UAMH 10762]|uniref:Pleckstrin homology domain-containing protein n=1 Tax=Baudoinia panamericana (strain UAMH 10762) TaxID=717646 RepID=M2LMK2_BAUPA|nr:uncharacterized protein BAUCODRAFT_493226 [Baudoinia panamericana UAMH 10762]EMC95542.1 hypothetical protein BAUCODRAFT_493226 [Baudoinia panamericana UAMH 10762]